MASVHGQQEAVPVADGLDLNDNAFHFVPRIWIHAARLDPRLASILIS